MGWRDVQFHSEDKLSFRKSPSKFYFVHSYRFECSEDYVIATTDYGQNINAAVQKDHIFGAQFHPERSQKKGLHLIKNFINFIKNKKNY